MKCDKIVKLQLRKEKYTVWESISRKVRFQVRLKKAQRRIFVTSFFCYNLRKFYVLPHVNESRKHCDVIYNRNGAGNTRWRILFCAPALSTWIITWDGHKYSRKFNFPSWRPMIYRWRYKRINIIYCRHSVYPPTARYFERAKFRVHTKARPNVRNHLWEIWRIFASVLQYLNLSFSYGNNY